MKKKTEKYQSYPEDINYILDNFDFEKVKIVMDCLEWYWVDNDAIPSIGELRKSARELLEEVMFEGQKQKKNLIISTGGFEASYIYDENFLSLCFIIEEQENSILFNERMINNV